jgi:hypothetical protein
MTGPITAIGLVLDHLTVRLRTDERLPATDTLVIEGPNRVNDNIPTVIMLGWIPGNDRDAFEVNTRTQVRTRVEEDFTINYLINVLSADADPTTAGKTARDRGLFVLGVLADILTTPDMSLDGQVGEIKLGPWSMSPFPKPNGIEVAVTGSIVGRSLL